VPRRLQEEGAGLRLFDLETSAPSVQRAPQVACGTVRIEEIAWMTATQDCGARGPGPVLIAPSGGNNRQAARCPLRRRLPAPCDYCASGARSTIGTRPGAQKKGIEATFGHSEQATHLARVFEEVVDRR